MHNRAARRLAPLFAALRFLEPRCLLVSYMPLARPECSRAPQGLTLKPRARK